MTKRRSRGEGGLHWDEGRQRWIATVTIGYEGKGKRVVRKASGRTKTEAKARLKEVLRDYDDGLPVIAVDGYTVGDAVREWLELGLTTRSAATRETCTVICTKHVLPHLGARKLRDLTAVEVERWLLKLTESLSTQTIRRAHACLNRAVKRAMARDRVKRNVVELCSIPHGRPGRPSKAFDTAQAEAILAGTREHRLYPYIVVSLLTGARTEELRALTWRHVHLEFDLSRTPALPPHLEVWRSVRAGGETKTRQSRRTLALPGRCIDALRQQWAQQERDRKAAGARWQEHDLVFATAVGTAMNPSNVRRDFRQALSAVPGLDPAQWTPRELRHSFVSLLSDSGVPIEEIARLVGHSSTTVTELVYRHQLRPVLQSGATVMDQLFTLNREV
ncbi:site-specific integrase [Kineococcus sp. NUM-3379]